MVGLKDLIGLLEKWPAWKRISEVPDRVDGIEQRLTKLEQLLAKAPGDACPKCGERAMRLTQPGRRLGSYPKEFRHDKWTCEKCGHLDERAVSLRK